MKGGLLFILSIFYLVCSKVGQDSRRSATEFEDALALNTSKSESVTGTNSTFVELGITQEGNSSAEATTEAFVALEGNVSNSETHDDVRKQVEVQNNTEEETSFKGVRPLRSAARLAENATTSTKKVKIEKEDPINLPIITELTGLKIGSVNATGNNSDTRAKSNDTMLSNLTVAKNTEKIHKVEAAVAKTNDTAVKNETASVPVDKDASLADGKVGKKSITKDQSKTNATSNAPKNAKLKMEDQARNNNTQLKISNKTVNTSKVNNLKENVKMKGEVAKTKEKEKDGIEKGISNGESKEIKNETHKALTRKTNSTASDASKNVSNITSKVDEEKKPLPVSKASTKVDEAGKGTVGATKVNETEKVAKGTTIVDKAEKVANGTTKADAEDQSTPVPKAPNKLEKAKNVSESITKKDEVLSSLPKVPTKPDKVGEVATSKAGKEAKAVSIPSKVPLIETQPSQKPAKPQELLEAVRFEIKTHAVLGYGADGGILSRMLKIKVTLRDPLPEKTNIVKLNVIPYRMKPACYTAMVSAANIEKDNNVSVFGDLEYRVTLEPLDAEGNQLAELSGVYLEAESGKWNEKFDKSLFFRTENFQGLTREWLHETFAEIGKIEPNKLTLKTWSKADGYRAELTVKETRSSMKLEQIRSVLGDRPNVLSQHKRTREWDTFLKGIREARDIRVYTKRENSAAPVDHAQFYDESPPLKWGPILFIFCLCLITIRTIWNHFRLHGGSVSISHSSLSGGRYNPISSVDDDEDIDSVNDVKEFLEEILRDLKVPQFEHNKYFIALSDLHLQSVKQLQTLDPHD